MTKSLRERGVTLRGAVLRVMVNSDGKVTGSKLELKGLKPFQACAALFGALAEIEAELVDEAVAELNAQDERKAA